MRRKGSSMIRVIAILLFVIAVADRPTLAAQACLDQVRALASTYALTIDPPGPVDTGRPGGVIEPPRTNDPAVIKPGSDQHSAMPTLPDVTPGTPKPGAGAATPLTPSDRTALEAILIAARDHANRGREEACLERLAKANEFIRRTRP